MLGRGSDKEIGHLRPRAALVGDHRQDLGAGAPTESHSSAIAGMTSRPITSKGWIVSTPTTQPKTV